MIKSETRFMLVRNADGPKWFFIKSNQKYTLKEAYEADLMNEDEKQRALELMKITS